MIPNMLFGKSNKTWCDMSMGWGDRLLSAILLQDEIDNYIGLDPNNNMHPYYNKMVELLVKE